MSRFYGSANTTTTTYHELSAATSGGWTWIQDPRAIGYGGYVYYGYVDEVGSKIAMRVVQDGASSAGTEIVLDAVAADEHSAPTFLVRASDSRLLVFYQVGSTEIYERISVNPLDSDPTLSGGWGSASSMNARGLGAPVSNRNYPNPIQLTGETDSPIYLFYRDNAVTPASSGTWRYAKSIDGGVTWTFVSNVFQSSTLANWAFLKPVPNGTTRVDFLATNNDAPTGVTFTGNVYHFYYEGGAFFKSDGSSAGTPILHEANVTLVYDGSTNPAWLSSIAIKAGQPVVAFPVFVSDTDHRYYYAACTAGTWATPTQIVAAGTHMATFSGPGGVQVHYPAGLELDNLDPNIVYCSVQAGAGIWELWTYTTADGGATFTPVAITTGSTDKNIRPVSPRNHGTRAVLWNEGTWSDYTVYSLATWG